MANAEQITEGAALQTFVHLAKNAKGKAATMAIQQALSATTVFVFGELLDLPNIQQLAGTEDEKFLDLLKIFAYGTYKDYKANSANLPPLTEMQTKKLKQLTIVSLAASSKVIPYAVLQEELDISGSLRVLEDVIIDSIYQGLVQGRIDQHRRTLEVEFAMGRDLKPEAIDDMINTLTNWSDQSDILLKTIKDQIQHANFMSDQEKKHKEDYTKRVETVKATLKAAMDSDHMMQGEYDGGEGFFGLMGSKGSRSKKGGGHRDGHFMMHHRDRKGN